MAAIGSNTSFEWLVGSKGFDLLREARGAPPDAPFETVLNRHEIKWLSRESHPFLSDIRNEFTRIREIVLKQLDWDKPWGLDVSFQEFGKDVEIIDASVVGLSKGKNLFIGRAMEESRERALHLIELGLDLSAATPEQQADRAFVLHAVKVNGRNLGCVQWACDDEEIVSTAMQDYPNSFKDASERIRNKREFTIEWLRKCGYVNTSKVVIWFDDLDFIMAYARHSDIYWRRPRDKESAEWKLWKYIKNCDDKEVIKKIVQVNGKFLSIVRKKFRDEEEVVVNAIKNDRDAFKYASKRLQNKDSVLSVYGRGRIYASYSEAKRIKAASDNELLRSLLAEGFLLTDIPDRAIAEIQPELVIEALSLNKENIRILDERDGQQGNAHPKWISWIDKNKNHKELIIALVGLRGTAIGLADIQFQKNEEIGLIAIKNDEAAFRCLDDSLQRNRSFAIKALTVNHKVYAFLPKFYQIDAELLALAIEEKGYKCSIEIESFKNKKACALYLNSDLSNTKNDYERFHERFQRMSFEMRNDQEVRYAAAKHCKEVFLDMLEDFRRRREELFSNLIQDSERERVAGAGLQEELDEAVNSLEKKLTGKNEIFFEELSKVWELTDGLSDLPDYDHFAQENERIIADLEEIKAKTLEELNDVQGQLEEMEGNLIGGVVSNEAQIETLKVSQEQLRAQIQPLESELKSRIELRNRCEELFKKDDSRGIYKIFYRHFFQKLTALSIGLQAAKSGLLQRANTSTDDVLGVLITVMTSLITTGTGIVLAPVTWGASTIIAPFIGIGVNFVAQKAVGAVRGKQKKAEFKRGASHFHGGLEGVDLDNKRLAFEITFLLQEHLRLCSIKGVKKIADDWFSKFAHSLVQKSSKGEESAKFSSIMLKLKKGKKDIETIYDLNWNSESLFLESGVSYPDADGKRIYESFGYKKDGVFKEKSRASKYGYLSFPNQEEANCYKEERVAQLKKKDSKKEGIWKRDLRRKGIATEVLDQLGSRAGVSKLAIQNASGLQEIGVQVESNQQTNTIRIEGLAREVERLNQQVSELFKMNRALLARLEAVSGKKDS
ncbi:MAG: DUF4116 domain-containing protein [Candidatus Algichlamydia australiensis]|nr:DUF4116 domain-containing protein [Chlamydiales bacterium]